MKIDTRVTIVSVRTHEISEELVAALHLLVRATEAARTAPSDRQSARRAIEQASVVSRLAKDEGFGTDSQGEIQGV